MMKISILGTTIFLGMLSFAHAGDLEDATQFHQIFLQEVVSVNPSVAQKELKSLHLIPDATLLKALSSDSVEKAMIKIQGGLLEALMKATPQRMEPLSLLLPPNDLTLVLVPGVFAEFIKNHAFEEVFERPSPLREKFKEQVTRAGAMASVNLIQNYKAGVPLSAWATPRRLDEVILMGQVQVAGRPVRVILFDTEFSSMESLGDARERAALFNSRLEKYLQLTGAQKMALVGYSRGTILGLEMLAQAERANRPWVKDVKAMISLSGVVFGSSLADSAYEDPKASMNKILMGLKETADSLEYRHEGSIFDRQNRGIALRNMSRWTDYLAHAASEFFEMTRGNKSATATDSVMSLFNIDPRAPFTIASRMAEILGLLNPVEDYNQNIDRFRYFVDQLLASVKELTSRARIDWWTKNEIPKNVTYYAITAAMANPDASVFEKELFENPLSYGRGSYDDITLLQNRVDYEVLSKVALNDSQVSVVQAAFLPEAIGQLNAGNKGVKTKFLGTAGTHHWGMALREVNKMVGGEVNGFPREALLRALAIQVLIDNP